MIFNRNLKTIFEPMSIIIGIICALPVLWLINSNLKYFYFGISVVIIWFLYFGIDTSHHKKIIIERKTLNNLHLGGAIFLSGVALYTFISLLVSYQTILSNIFALFMSSLFPGYLVIQLTKLKHYLSILEQIIYGYFLSYIITGICFLAMINMQNSGKSMIFSGIICIGSLVHLISKIRNNKFSQDQKPVQIDRFNANGLMLCILYYIVSYVFLYPNFIRIVGNDIERHLALAQTLIQNPQAYARNYYLLHHLHEALFLSLGKFNVIVNQVLLVCLNLFYPLAFYVAAKRILGKVQKYAPIIATFFFTFLSSSFGGLGWMFVGLWKLKYPGALSIGDLTEIAQYTNNSTIYAIEAMWYIPLFTATLGMILILNLMANEALPDRVKFILITIIEYALILTHVAEGVFFGFFIAFLTVIYGFREKAGPFHPKKTLVPVLAGGLLAFFIYYILDLLEVFGSPLLNDRLSISLLLSLTALFLALLIREGLIWPVKEQKVYKRINSKKVYKALNLLALGFSIILLGAFIFSIFYRFFHVDNESYPYPEGFNVPWYGYSLFGINIILILGTWFVISFGNLQSNTDQSEVEQQKWKNILIFNRFLKRNQGETVFNFLLIFFIFTLGFSKTLVYFNNNWDIIYIETRIVMFAMIPMSMLLSFFMVYLKKWINTQKTSKEKEQQWKKGKKIDRGKEKRKREIERKKSSQKQNDTIPEKKKPLVSVNGRQWAGLTLIGFIVMMNFTIIPINISYWYMFGQQDDNYTIPQEEIDAINYINSLATLEGNHTILTVSDRSQDMIEMAWGREKIKIPESIQSLSALYTYLENYDYYSRLTGAELQNPTHNNYYIYITAREEEFLQERDFLRKWIQMCPILYENSYIAIYNCSTLTAPQTDQSTILAMENLENRNPTDLALPMLATKNADYSIMDMEDFHQMDGEKILLNKDFKRYLSNLSQLNSQEWEILDGEWLFTDNLSFTAGGTPTDVVGQLLSKHEYTELSFEIDARMIEGEYTLSNYLHFIYDYQSPEDYKILKLNFAYNNSMYLQVDEEWPGIDLNLPRIYNKSYRIEFTVNETQIDFRIENETVYTTAIDSTGGKFGFEYRHVDLLKVDFLEIEAKSKNAEDMWEYFMDFVEQGGDLVVFNTDGYGDYFQLLTGVNSVNSSLLTATGIQLGENAWNFDFQEDLAVNQFDIVGNTNISIEIPLLYHIRDDLTSPTEKQIPFVMEMQLLEGSIIYVNSFPISNFLKTTETSFPVLKLLKHI